MCTDFHACTQLRGHTRLALSFPNLEAGRLQVESSGALEMLHPVGAGLPPSCRNFQKTLLVLSKHKEELRNHSSLLQG